MVNARGLVLLGLFSLTTNACGGKTPAPPPGPGSGARPGPATVIKPPEPATPEPPVAADRAPELFEPLIKKVGVGQKISFATTAIDQDLDETRVEVTKMPASAKFDAITQTVTWTPTKADMPSADFTLLVTQPARKSSESVTWTFEVTPNKQPVPVAEQKTAVIETLLMIRQTKRLEQVNKDWPLDKLLLVAAEGFKPQFDKAKAAALTGKLDKAVLFDGFLSAFAQTHANPRLDPKAPEFDKAVFGDPKAWKIVTIRPRIDRAWTELRVVYQAVNAPEPVFAMFRIRPVTEFVPALPRPAEERAANNKVFLGLVAKHLLDGGAPSEKFLKNQAAHSKAVGAFMNELMAYDDTKTAPYLKTFAIGIALEARMGGGSVRKPDGTYNHGDGWGWSAQKPFITPDGTTQQFTNVIIPGFWTRTVPSEDNKTWTPTCGPRWTKGDKQLAPGHEILCRKTLGFVDLPALDAAGTGDKVKGGRIDSNHLYIEHKTKFMVADLALDDGRRDVGEENGITCSQCHIRNFGMHDYSDPANTDPSKGVPKNPNKKIATLNFQIVPSTHWEEFTLEFLKHQECRAKQNYEQFLTADAAKGLTCPFTNEPG